MGAVRMDNERRLGLVIGLAAGLLNGLLAVGQTLLIPAMVHVLHLDQHKAHGTSLWIILPTSLVSFAIYSFRYDVPLEIGWKITLGGAVGAIVGAKLLKRLSGLWLKRMFAAIMLFAAIRMVVG